MNPTICAIAGFLAGLILTFQVTQNAAIVIYGGVFCAALALSARIPGLKFHERWKQFLFLISIGLLTGIAIVNDIDLGLQDYGPMRFPRSEQTLTPDLLDNWIALSPRSLVQMVPPRLLSAYMDLNRSQFLLWPPLIAEMDDVPAPTRPHVIEPLRFQNQITHRWEILDRPQV